MSEDELYRGLGQALAKARRDRGLSQAAVAARIGLTRASLANLESGRQRVLLHHLYRLVTALELASILDLAPETWSFDDGPPPARFEGSTLTAKEADSVEQFLSSLAAAPPSRTRRR